ncbi:hypothetical protein TSMEX_011553 [Taenia solium]|eukprot:TsM_000170300 transcript=TsM_000170300 gene=TsM_000170300
MTTTTTVEGVSLPTLLTPAATARQPALARG